ncbi:MAG: ferritin family protein [Bacillota bacterium]
MTINELKVIRQALINEQEAIGFYTMAAGQAKNKETETAFLELAAEEQMHIDWLLGLYRSISDRAAESFDPSEFEEPTAPVKYDLTTIGRESGSLAVSVFGIAVNLEKAAIDFYAEAARNTELPAAKALYEKLVRWESQHLEQFQKEYDRLRDEWWEQQGFSPA